VDPESRTLRTFVLVATAFVVFGGVAGFMVWWLAQPKPALPTAPGVDPTIRPVDFPPSIPQAERAALRAKVDALLAADEGSPAAAAAKASLVAAGSRAVPPLLDAIHRASTGAGFSAPENRAKVRAATGALDGIRARLEPGLSWPKTPPLDTAASADALARAWFAWWSTAAGGDAAEKSSETPVPK